MPANEEKIVFSLTESVWFKQGMAVTDIRSLSLEPVVHIEEKDDSVAIKGYLQLYGEYDPDLSGYAETEKDSLRDITGERKIQEVTVGQNGVWTLKHRFPIDVDIPRERIGNMDDLSIHIQMFDYELLNERCLEIQADIEVAGIGEKINPVLESEQTRMEAEEDLFVYKTADPQIYAEMDTRETAEVFLEQVCEPPAFESEQAEQAASVSEMPLYIQPMPSSPRNEEDENKVLWENSEVSIDDVPIGQVQESNPMESEAECQIDMGDTSISTNVERAEGFLSIDEGYEKNGWDSEKESEICYAVPTESSEQEISVRSEVEPQSQNCEYQNDDLMENRFQSLECPSDDSTENLTKEIPVLSEIEDCIQEAEDRLEVYTDQLPPKPKQPVIFHFQSNWQPTSSINHEDPIERVDLSMLFAQADHPDLSNDSSSFDEIKEDCVHEESKSLEFHSEEDFVRKENPMEKPLKLEMYDLADGPKKVKLEDTEEDEIQETAGEEVPTQPIKDFPEENALYLAKLFQSKEEKRTQMKIYFAQKGDSVQSLAIKFNVPIHHIHKFNHLADDELKVGDAIYIPTKLK